MAKKNYILKNSTNILFALFLLIIIFSCLIKDCFNFIKEGLSNNKELVLVHMNGCGHCEKLMPHWDSASSENKSSVSMRKVEMSQNDGPDLVKEHNIKGFPSILLLQNGRKLKEYNGERNKKGLLDFLNIY